MRKQVRSKPSRKPAPKPKPKPKPKAKPLPKPKPQLKSKPQPKPKPKPKPQPIKKHPASKPRKVEVEEIIQVDPEMVLYEGAIELFNAGQFEAAKEKFAELLQAHNRDLAHSAELRIRMCEQRLTAG